MTSVSQRWLFKTKLFAGLVAAGSLALAGTGSAESRHQQTLRFDSIPKSAKAWGHHTLVTSGIDKTAAKVIGTNSTSLVYHASSKTVTGDVSMAFESGAVYAHITATESGAVSGTITGGTRGYRGVTGTMTATGLIPATADAKTTHFTLKLTLP